MTVDNNFALDERKKLLLEKKQDLFDQMTKKYAELLSQNVPVELQNNITMQQFIEDYQGSIDTYMKSLKPKRYLLIH